MSKDITPKHLRCFPSSCPSVHELDDGRLVIVGEYAPGLEWKTGKTRGEDETILAIPQEYFSDLPELSRLRAENERLREALEPFIQHGRAVGAFGGDQGPYRLYTTDGYRCIPADDFWRALATLKAANAVRPTEEPRSGDTATAAGGDVGLTPHSNPQERTQDG